MRRLALCLLGLLICSPARAQFFTPLVAGNNLKDLPNAAAARVNLGAGAANGLATLGASGTVPLAQLPALPLSKISGFTRLDVRDFGATGNGVTDDSAAIAAAFNAASADWAAGKPVSVYFPAGVYYINSATPLPTFYHVPGAVVGAGQFKTFLEIGPAYSGPVLSWSEAWTDGGYNGTTLNIPTTYAGPAVSHLSIVGNTTATNEQDAIVFYDRDDFASIHDVSVIDMHGACLSTGTQKNTTQAYLREFHISDLRCWTSGTTTIPGVLFSSSSVAPGSDGTNTGQVVNLDMFGAKGVGLRIGNQDNNGVTRGINFVDLRVEQSGGDDVEIGNVADGGPVAGIRLIAPELISPPAGHYALSIAQGATSTGSNYANEVVAGHIGPGAGGGVYVDGAFGAKLDFTGVATTGPMLIYGPNAGDVVVDGQWVSGITTAYTGTLTPLGTLPNYTNAHIWGLPNEAAKMGFATMVGTTSAASAARLTMDGAAASTANCFAPSYEQMYNIGIRVMARDATNPANWLAWRLDQGVLGDTTGPGSVTWTAPTVTPLTGGTGSGAAFAVSADTTNGCLDPTFTPPSGNTDTWNISMQMSFVRAP